MPLFGGIISDLFPGVDLPKPDYGVFMEALKNNIAKRKLQPVPWFIDKIVQVRMSDITFIYTYIWFSPTSDVAFSTE